MIVAAQRLRIWVLSMEVLGSNAIKLFFFDIFHAPHGDCSIRVF